MLIFLAPRIVLLSVPKTGTTALEEALAPRAEIAFRSDPSVKHLNLRQYLNRIQPLIARQGQAPFETVAVIRKPLDWRAYPYPFLYGQTDMSLFDLAAWRDWLRVQLIRTVAPYLHAEVVQTNFDFYGTTLQGTPELRARWKRGVSLVEGAAGA